MGGLQPEREMSTRSIQEESYPERNGEEEPKYSTGLTMNSRKSTLKMSSEFTSCVVYGSS